MSNNNHNQRRHNRRCKRNSGQGKYDIIRITESVRHDLQFIKGIVGIAPNVPDGDVVETLVKMFKQKKIGQLIEGKNYRIPLDTDLVTFFNDKDAQKTIKEYEYLLNEKQSTLDNYIKYLDTACELAKIDKVQVIEIVKNNNKNTKNKKNESFIDLLD
jgi:hypothetical protein